MQTTSTDRFLLALSIMAVASVRSKAVCVDTLGVQMTHSLRSLTITFVSSVAVQAKRIPTAAGSDIGDEPVLIRTVRRDGIGLAQAPIAVSAGLCILQRWVQPQTIRVVVTPLWIPTDRTSAICRDIIPCRTSIYTYRSSCRIACCQGGDPPVSIQILTPARRQSLDDSKVRSHDFAAG